MYHYKFSSIIKKINIFFKKNQNLICKIKKMYYFLSLHKNNVVPITDFFREELQTKFFEEFKLSVM